MLVWCLCFADHGGTGRQDLARFGNGMDVGNDEAIVGLFDGIRQASAALLLAGPAGIGKSHRWTAAVRVAEARGWRLLVARPTEAATRLGVSALLDLLSDVSDEELDALPRPQRTALRAALLRETQAADDADAPGPGAVSHALVTLVTLLARDRPVVVAVDDLQWIDATTDAMLAFLAGRLPERDVALVLAARTPAVPVPSTDGATEPAVIAELVRAGRLHRDDVAPLREAEVEALVSERIPLPRLTLARVASVSGGNPFYALELARAWAAASETSGTSVPESLRSLVGHRVGGLPAPVRHTVAACAALARPDVSTLRRLGGYEHLADAERAGILTVDLGGIRFTHPLLAAAAYDALTGVEQAVLHAQLANAIDEEEERARHLALAADGPDESVAAALDVAVGRAIARGSALAAAEAAELAVRLTPAAEPAAYRTLRLAWLLYRAGETAAAERNYRRLVDDAAVPGRVRATALIRLADLAMFGVSHDVAGEYAVAAIEAAQRLDDPELLAEAHLMAAKVWAGTPVDWLAHATSAHGLLAGMPAPDVALLAATELEVADKSFYAGYGVLHERFERAIELERTANLPRGEQVAVGYYMVVLILADVLDRARGLVDQQERDCREDDVEGYLPWTLHWRVQLELAAGRFDAARRAIDEQRAASQRAGQVGMETRAAANRALLDLMCGDLARARQTLDRLVAAEPVDTQLAAIVHARAGAAALYDGDAQAALDLLETAERLNPTDGALEPSRMAPVPLRIETLIALGRHDEARRLLERYEAVAGDRPSARAHALRCQGLLRAVHGEEAEAEAAFAAAAAVLDGAGVHPFEHARILLLHGQTLRRFRRKAAARDTLRAARERFADLGASGWVARTDAELARIGLRPPAAEELTVTEQRVAELAATGMTRADIAGLLFISPHTVAANLGRIYRKLGVANRAELAARFPPP